jgi:hypothetical protein
MFCSRGIWATPIICPAFLNREPVTDAIVSALSLPDFDGFDCILALKGIPSLVNIPVVVHDLPIL